MIKLTIDGVEIEVEEGSTLMHACEAAGKEIPRFCYHERLSIAGNCRMCLVEIENAPKPVASCAMPAGEGMAVRTNSELVKKAREGVLEFMLINHPLDCPICDQGGECDLQDQTMGYGMGMSRYEEPKRAVENKHMGPLISTIMTRCIHCTRCVRFCSEVAGVSDMGAVGRGENMEITTYLEKALASELSGNVVDLCPVGALTSRPYAFNARSWELTPTESIDAMDGVGSAIRIDSRANQVMRVLPRVHDDINEEWISDKTRHALDGLRYQRLDRPYIRGSDGRLKEASWDEAFAVIAGKLKRAHKTKGIAAIAGGQCDSEWLYAMKQLLGELGSKDYDSRPRGSVLSNKSRSNYIFNSGFAGIDEADYILLIGTNPRHEAAVINARIRRRWLEGGIEIARIGQVYPLTYEVQELGASPQILKEIVKGSHEVFKKMKRAKHPMIIIGEGAIGRSDSMALLHQAEALAKSVGVITKSWNGFNILSTRAAQVGALDLGFVPPKGGKDTEAIIKAAQKGELGILFLMAEDEVDFGKISKSTLVVYQGSHGDRGAKIADVILPGAAWCEKDAIFVNSEGRVQYAQRAVFPPGDAREDWAIIRALSSVLGVPLPFDNFKQLREQMISEFPIFSETDVLIAEPFKAQGKAGKLKNTPIRYALEDGFYMTCAISRHSPTMAECMKAFFAEKEAAE